MWAATLRASQRAGGGVTAVILRRAFTVPGDTAISAVVPPAVTDALQPANLATTVSRTGSAASRRALALRYWTLSKGKLTVWVTLSALPGYLVAVPGVIDPFALSALMGGTFLTSASAQTLNQLAEVDRDARMLRTAKRPLPSGRLKPREATAFAAVTGSLGLGVLCVGASPIAAAVSATTMATYIGLYTPLKTVTPYNTHVGAISGSLPTIIGFAAACGTGLVASPWAPHALWLFTMQTLWQMPHFYALAWLHRADYIRGGYNMFPLTDATGHATASMSKPYLVVMCVMPVAASAFGLASWMLPIGAAVPSALWWQSLRTFEQKPNAATCRTFFLGSLSYLLAVLVLFTGFARVERQPLVESPCDLSERKTAPTNAGTCSPKLPALGPAWRDALHARLSEACPHEAVRHFFGILRSSCPFGRDGVST